MKRLILALFTGAALAASLPAHAAVKTIVLVHGAFADGSGWKPVADILVSHGYSVRVVQEPETAFDADVAATRRVLDKAGPCVLVGHSYGGMIITEAGKHPDVKALVYVAAFQPDVGESVGDLADKMPPANKSIEPVGHRTPRQPRNLSFARARGGSIDRKSGYGSEVGHRFPLSASGTKRRLGNVRFCAACGD
jgi:pimeloyl-ACP methyl ester carboxylesterase